MGYYLSKTQMDEALHILSQTYRIFAPCLMGQYIRYGEIHSLSQIVYDRKSDFSAKEVFYPIVQTLMYFTDNECRESELDDERDILIFARACDINAIRRLDTIFLENGNQADMFYQRRRKKVACVLMECTQSFETCFCVSMGSNIAHEYSAAVGFLEDGVKVLVRDRRLEGAFCKAALCDYTPAFVMENQKKVHVPQIDDRCLLKDIFQLEYWRSFDDRCISCGGCNTVCPTCSCFDSTDIIYNETSREGERRRIWSSCMLDDFTVMAGGHSVRSLPGDRMRFKTMHKIYDFKARFGRENMCVGCGRCDLRCPKQIHFSETIDTLAAQVTQLKRGKNGDMPVCMQNNSEKEDEK